MPPVAYRKDGQETESHEALANKARETMRGLVVWSSTMTLYSR
jgi:hypothetical protein